MRNPRHCPNYAALRDALAQLPAGPSPARDVLETAIARHMDRIETFDRAQAPYEPTAAEDPTREPSAEYRAYVEDWPASETHYRG